MLTQASKVTAVGLALLCGGLALAPACTSGGDDDDDDGGGASNAGSDSGGTSNGGAKAGNGGVAGGGTAGTGQMAVECPGVVPTEPLLADFETTPDAGEAYEWGSADQGETEFWGGTFNYPDAIEVTVADGKLTAAGNVAEYAGFGLYVQNCADASAYEGVRFKISGNPPMGKLRFALQTNQNEWAAVKGSCLAPEANRFITCVHPSVEIEVTETETTVEVKWADLGGGKPTASAKTTGEDVIGLQWILPWTEKATPYDTSISIDDVELIGQGSSSAAAGAGGVGNEPGPDAGGAGGAQ